MGLWHLCCTGLWNHVDFYGLLVPLITVISPMVPRRDVEHDEFPRCTLQLEELGEIKGGVPMKAWLKIKTTSLFQPGHVRFRAVMDSL